MIRAMENCRIFHILRTAVLATDTTSALASILSTVTAPKTISVSLKGYAVSTQELSAILL